MRTISDTVYNLLMAQGLARGTVGAVGPSGIGTGVPGRDQTHPLTDAAAGGPRIRSGNSMERTGTKAPAKSNREVGKRHDLDGGTSAHRSVALRLIVNPNMSGMPMRKRAGQTPFLISIDGGRQ